MHFKTKSPLKSNRNHIPKTLLNMSTFIGKKKVNINLDERTIIS
jgi:hypothetical protein